jgi:hypothetical protein
MAGSDWTIPVFQNRYVAFVKKKFRRMFYTFNDMDCSYVTEGILNGKHSAQQEINACPSSDFKMF